jgi:hypothetical protein
MCTALVLSPARSLVVEASCYRPGVVDYAGPDIFQLQVYRRARASVHFTD